MKKLLTMDEDDAESMLRRMDVQLLDLIGRDKVTVDSPEREVHASESPCGIEFQDDIVRDLELDYSTSVDATTGPSHFSFIPDENCNPEDTAPQPTVPIFGDFESASNPPLLANNKERSERSKASGSCTPTSLLSVECGSLDVDNMDDDIQHAVDAIREEASRVETALAIDQVHTMQNEIKSMTALLQAQSDQIRHLKRELKAKDERLATMELERDLAQADFEAIKSGRGASSTQKTERQTEFFSKDMIPPKRVPKKDVGTNTQKVLLKPNTRYPADIDGPPSTIVMKVSPPVPHKCHVRKPMDDVSFQPTADNKSVASSPQRREKSPSISKTPSHRMKFNVLPPPRAIIDGSSVPNCTGGTVQVHSSLNARSQRLQNVQTSASRLDITTREGAQSSLFSNSVSVSSQCYGVFGPSDKLSKHDLRPRVRRSKSLSGNRSDKPLKARAENPLEARERRSQSRICGLPPLLRKKTPHNNTRRKEKKQQALPKRRPDDGSLQAQVEELAQRLKFSVDNSEGLRKRLVMISHYYEGTVRRLQENIVSLKEEMSRMEHDLVKQIVAVDREKRDAVEKSVRLLQERDEATAKLSFSQVSL